MNFNSLFSEKRTIQINTAPGLTPFLMQELEVLGYSPKKTSNFGVSVEGTLQDTIRLNIVLRTAHRILLELKTAKIDNAEQLYKMAKAMPWEELIETDGYFSVDSFVKNDTMRDNRFANVRIKDAIADRFMEKFKRRPDSGSEFSGIVIYLFWHKDHAVIYLDTSGPSLAKHGYRIKTTEAPLQESLAAALVMASNWDVHSTFVNPMCGSGTLAIEAAWMALGISPGMNRESFGFEHIKDYNPSYFNQLLFDLNKLVKKQLPFKIYASDISESVLDIAKENAKAAGVDDFIVFEQVDFKNIELPLEKGTIVMNPPYGERLGDKNELVDMYTEIGSFFKRAAGWNGNVLSADKELDKWIKLKPAQKTPCFNGRIECRLLRFELYEGSRRAPKES
jgi:23S rRNA G2445 N2-methylase RlmL